MGLRGSRERKLMEEMDREALALCADDPQVEAINVTESDPNPPHGRNSRFELDWRR